MAIYGLVRPEWTTTSLTSRLVIPAVIKGCAMIACWTQSGQRGRPSLKEDTKQNCVRWEVYSANFVLPSREVIKPVLNLFQWLLPWSRCESQIESACYSNGVVVCSLPSITLKYSPQSEEYHGVHPPIGPVDLLTGFLFPCFKSGKWKFQDRVSPRSCKCRTRYWNW